MAPWTPMGMPLHTVPKLKHFFFFFEWVVTNNWIIGQKYLNDFFFLLFHLFFITEPN